MDIWPLYHMVTYKPQMVVEGQGHFVQCLKLQIIPLVGPTCICNILKFPDERASLWMFSHSVAIYNMSGISVVRHLIPSFYIK